MNAISMLMSYNSEVNGGQNLTCILRMLPLEWTTPKRTSHFSCLSSPLQTFFHLFFVCVSMIATEGTSGVQGYPLWDRDEVKSNVDKMEKELEMGGGGEMGARPTTDETQGI